MHQTVQLYWICSRLWIFRVVRISAIRKQQCSSRRLYSRQHSVCCSLLNFVLQHSFRIRHNKPHQVIKTIFHYKLVHTTCPYGRSQWPRSLRRRSTAARLLRAWVRIPPGARMFVCCVFSGRGLCDELITRPEESHRLWRVVVCDQETSWKRRP
jgi:hypothetical protein